MKINSALLAAILAASLAAPAFASAPCPVAAKSLSQASAKFDEHSKGILILARDGSAESRADEALFRSKAVEAALSGFLVVEYRTDLDKAMLMNEMSEAEMAALSGADLSPARLAKIAGPGKISATVIQPSRVLSRQGEFGSVESAVKYFTAI